MSISFIAITVLGVLIAAAALGKTIAALTKTDKDDKIFQMIHDRLTDIESIVKKNDKDSGK